MLIAILAKKLNDAVSQADLRLLIDDKDYKFFEILAVFGIYDFL